MQALYTNTRVLAPTVNSQFCHSTHFLSLIPQYPFAQISFPSQFSLQNLNFTGNICRSPAAEGVFRDLVKKRGLDSNFTIDSAGTIGYHEGNPADSRMRSTAKRRGIEITSISRPIRPSDFRDFDLILAMDKSNRADILEAFDKWKQRNNLPPDADKKVKLMCSYCKKHDETEVPDPYYGGQQGFEKVMLDHFTSRSLIMHYKLTFCWFLNV
ncbi:uncharacterized protein LOC110689642 isoform X3 [Chenopodium quinoa]|uniref:uncharacterized protein LOC110689642 isoform X3 n=1 Tax=Chenopodium quinoa TaxID=63459 RepID=UPI000B78088E|nr:uncharacterized protein LOC110689642 isoform X3 [Chenopodium quinoa]